MATGTVKAANVTAANPKITGGVFAAPLGTALPTDAKTELDTAFRCLGYVSEDGVTNENSPDKENTLAWGGAVVAASQKEKPDTFKITFLEIMNIEVLKTIYGEDNVTGDLDTGIEVRANASEPEAQIYVIDMILKGGVMKRIVIPHGEISELGEIGYKSNDVSGYETTITAIPGDDGDTHKEYIVKAVATESLDEAEE